MCAFESPQLLQGKACLENSFWISCRYLFVAGVGIPDRLGVAWRFIIQVIQYRTKLHAHKLVPPSPPE